MAVTMYSRTSSALFFIIICTSAFWNAKATTTGEPPTEEHSHSAASINIEDVPPDTPAFPVGETTLPPVLTSSPNSTFNNDSNTAMPSTELTLVTTPTPVKNSPEPGSSTVGLATLHSSIAVPQTEHLSSPVIASTTLFSSIAASEKEHVSSTVNKSNNTTVLPTQETTPQDNSTIIFPVEPNTTLVSGKNENGMKYSETILTSIFSTILVVVLLTILAFCFNKYRKRQSQYSHRPLHENVYESDGFSPPDDTLVISGGLYDAPRIYNPNMTVLEEDDAQPEYVSFSSRPGQFRLEFLPGDKDTNLPHSDSLRRNV